MAQKYNLKKGDSIILSDEENEMDYAFQVADITQYSSGLYAFMNINSNEKYSFRHHQIITIWLYQRRNCRLTLENYMQRQVKKQLRRVQMYLSI